MKKLVLALSLSLIAVSIMAYVVVQNKDKVFEQSGLLGVNLPDRCVSFDQIASRSTKDLVKAGTGKVYSFSVVSSASQVAYFQLYDQSNATLLRANFATPSFVLPIPGEISAERPTIVDFKFPSPFALTASGIFFALSVDYANYSAVSDSATDFSVQICFE